MVNLRFWRRKNATETEGILQQAPQEADTVPSSIGDGIFQTPVESSGRLDFRTPSSREPTAVTDNVEVTDEPIQEESEKGLTDVNQCIEDIGFGKYQWKIVFVMGLMSFADSCEIWLSTIILSTNY